MSRVKVLVVDDSITMRGLISAALRRDPEIEVVGTAGDPLEARAAIKALQPDVLTLDVEMPNMNGLDFLERLMRLRPMPVVMVSTLTQRGTETTLEALALGAVDCVGKPGAGGAAEAFASLPQQVKAAALAKPRARQATTPASRRTYRGSGDVIAIGSSTGGVEALQAILTQFPENCPATVVTQHMPAAFTGSFAERLNRLCAASVSEAVEGAPLSEGRIYIAPGGRAHLTVSGVRQRVCRLRDADPVCGHRPSVDVLFGSVAVACGPAAAGLILTGMGRDGAEGLLAMRQAGARTFGQDEASSVVYGMPGAAMAKGAVERQAPLHSLAGLILDACERPARVN